MAEKNLKTAEPVPQKGPLAKMLSASGKGARVDEGAVRRRQLDLHGLKKLEDAFRAGWLHNVLSRITPLTMRRRDDYLAMADIFITTADDAEHVLDRFDGDLELFCSMADIKVTRHMTSATVSEELRAHVELYNDVANVFYAKFDIPYRDPIQTLATQPIMDDYTNPFVKEFMDKKFQRN